MKIQKLKQKNLLIKVDQASKIKEVKGLIINPGKTAYLVAEVIETGEDVYDNDLFVGAKILVHAQSLNYPIDNPELDDLMETKEAVHFIIFHEQALAILNE